MVATFFLDWGISLAVGMLFGVLGRRAGARAFRAGFAYQQVGVLALSIALYVRMPDWMWMYAFDDVPLLGVVAAFVLYEIAFLAGYRLAPALEGARRGAGIATLGAVAAALAAAQVITRVRLWSFGTTEEFRAGTARTLADAGGDAVFLGTALTLSAVALAVAVLATLRPAAR